MEEPTKFLIDSSQLTNLIGTQITGLTFRTAPNIPTTWPTAATTCANLIYKFEAFE